MNQGERSLQETRASILLYSFLQNSSNCSFASELCALKPQLLASATLHDDFDDGELQTDGNRFVRPQSDVLVSQSDEEIFRTIGAQLATIGDKLAAEIDPSIVQNLAQFMVGNVSEEAISSHMSQAVEAVVKRMPLEMEREKAMLIVTMVLAKKVANTMPSFLQQVFSTTVNYINHNLRDYVNNLAPES
ncbi:BH3-interacting domain death agonist [Pogona vitticeps]